MTKWRCVVILVGILVLCTPVIAIVLSSITGILDLSDGFGFGRGEIEGRRQLYQVKLRLQYGQFRMAGKQALTGIQLLVDSEVRWNLARPYLERSRNLCQQKRYTEAYDVCQTLKKLLVGYKGFTYDYGSIHGECLMIERESKCNTGSPNSFEKP